LVTRDSATPIESTLSAVQELHDEGLFEEFGVSNFSAWQVAEASEIAARHGWIRPSVYQGLYNAIARAVEPELFKCLGNYSIRFHAYNPLAGPDFRLVPDRIMWLERELLAAERANLRSVVFLHAYPADLRENVERVRDLFTRYRVVAVDMGHTNYNELANDGHTKQAPSSWRPVSSWPKCDDPDGHAGRMQGRRLGT
jgi:aldo/keto reductase family protein